MRWLLIASLLCLPMAACGGTTETDEETVTEEAKFECKGCGTKSATQDTCDCGAEMTPIE
jgi:hypothetical protein